jgi:hypothetical protein
VKNIGCDDSLGILDGCAACFSSRTTRPAIRPPNSSGLLKTSDSHLEGPNPFFLVYVDGKPWPIRPDQMTVGDILAYVHHRYGELFVGFCRQMPNFIIH